MVICLERGTDLHMAQLMPLPLCLLLSLWFPWFIIDYSLQSISLIENSLLCTYILKRFLTVNFQIRWVAYFLNSDSFYTKCEWQEFYLYYFPVGFHSVTFNLLFRWRGRWFSWLLQKHSSHFCKEYGKGQQNIAVCGCLSLCGQYFSASNSNAGCIGLVVSTSDCGMRRLRFQLQHRQLYSLWQPLHCKALAMGYAHLVHCLGWLSLPPSVGW